MNTSQSAPKDSGAEPTGHEQKASGAPAKPTRPPAPEPVDTRERGAPVQGEPQFTQRRLFVQFLALAAPDTVERQATFDTLTATLTAHQIPAVIYEDLNDPLGFGLVSWNESPEHFVGTLRAALGDAGLANVQWKPEYTMFGRTYSVGYEPRLEWWLVDRPQETMLNPEWPWAVWYPLRRNGAFARLDSTEQSAILREHAILGRAYGMSDLAHDVRLACHGLDANDNEFVIGLVGQDLHPLSHLIQAMRKTRQTSEFIESMGPFFIGRATWRNTGGGSTA